MMDTTSAKILAIRSAAGNLNAVCCTCGRAPASPYRRIIEGKVAEGCIDAIHSAGGLYGESAAWHNRKEAKAHRTQVLANLKR